MGEFLKLENNYNFGVVKLHLKFIQRTKSTPHKFQTRFPSQNLIFFQPGLCFWKGIELNMEEVIDLSNKNMIHVKKNNIEYLQFRKLLEYKNLLHCYTLRVHDVNFKMNWDKEHKYILEENYNKICNALNIERNSIVRPHQAHTDCVKIVENAEQKFEKVDGLITNKKNVNLVLSFADCTPILLYDPVNNVISNVHSGWRGTVQKIGQKAVLKMINNFNTKPENIIACIGPCIGKCDFEVEEDVKNIFETTFSYLNRNSDIIEKRKNKYNIDTTLINKLMLQEVGIKAENIIESGICTYCNSDYMHSYRANGNQVGTNNVCILGLK